MKKIKPPAVAGKFYTDNKEELISQLNSFSKNNIKDYNYSSRAIIVPHAGYIYSGQLASKGFQYLDKNIKNIFIFAPAHSVPVDGIALSPHDEWSTPLGEIPLNQKINEELDGKFECSYNEAAFRNEHAIEVQVPFIQTSFQDVKIIPLLVGFTNHKNITEIIDHYWSNSENGFVISSDLSHFYSNDDAVKIDTVTAEMIESNDIKEFNHKQACGSMGICGLVEFTQSKKYSLIRVGQTNSAETSGDTSSVVGYGSWLLYEGEKSDFIKKYFSEFTIDVCKKSILYGLDNKTHLPVNKLENIPTVFEEYGACFVTLEVNDNLRGCIGSIIAHQPLIEDLVLNAYSAAFSDTRFSPLTKNEFEKLEIAVSLLSSPVQMSFKDEDDLLSQIQPFIDGIIIKDGQHQAVYLPSVWEQLPNKTLFLNSLKQKAGLSPHHFSKNFETYRFTTEYIK